jgi:hypothetical protein
MNKLKYFSSINTFVSNESDKAAPHNAVSTSSPHTEGRATYRNYSNNHNVCEAQRPTAARQKNCPTDDRLTSNAYSASNRFESQVEGGHLGSLTLPYLQANARSTAVKLSATASSHMPPTSQSQKAYATLFDVSVQKVPFLIFL